MLRKCLRSLRRKWRTAMEALTQNDAAQAKALKTVVRLFAAMLILTLVAQAAAGAALPHITLTTASQGTLVHTLETAGVLAAANGVPFAVPEGLLVEAVYPVQGETITQGAAVARFFQESVTLALAQAKASEAQITQQIIALQKGEVVDAYEVTQAQTALDTAYADQEKAHRAGLANVAQATQTRDAAQQTLDTVLSQSPVDPAAEAAARSALLQEEEALLAVQREAEAANTMALQTAQQAENARNSTLHAYEKTALSAAKQAAQGKADAGVLAVALTRQKNVVQQLTALVQADFVYSAPATGTLTQLSLAAGTLSTPVGGAIASEGAGFQLTFPLTKEQAETVTVGMEVTVRQDKSTEQRSINALGAPLEDGRVMATVSLPAGSWKNGAAQVSMELLRETHQFTLPPTAVQQDMAGQFIYCVEARDTVLGEQDVLVRVPVTVLGRTPERVAVKGGIAAQMRIVNTATKPLQAGARVRVQP